MEIFLILKARIMNMNTNKTRFPERTVSAIALAPSLPRKLISVYNQMYSRIRQGGRHGRINRQLRLGFNLIALPIGNSITIANLTASQLVSPLDLNDLSVGVPCQKSNNNATYPLNTLWFPARMTSTRRPLPESPKHPWKHPVQNRRHR
jgi:hypothetical protein